MAYNKLPYDNLIGKRIAADGVYPGQFEPSAIGQPRHYSRLYFSYVYPCEDREAAKSAATYYLREQYAATNIVLFDNPHLRSQSRFYALFIRGDK